MTRTASLARHLNNFSIHRTSSWGPFISWTIKIICGGLVQMWHRTIEDSKWLVHASDHQCNGQWPLHLLFLNCCLLPCVIFFVSVLYHSSLINHPFLIVLAMLFSFVKCSRKRWKIVHPRYPFQHYHHHLQNKRKPWPRPALCAMPQVATVTAFLVGYRVVSCNTFSISTSKPTQKIMLHKCVMLKKKLP